MSSQPSPSPSSYRRRANSTQTSATSPKISPRESRSSITSSSRSSSSTKPTSPTLVPTSTVITVNNAEGAIAVGRRKSKESAASPTASKLDSPQEHDEDFNDEPLSGNNTHIIRVSGPVTNLDETVTSGETQMTEVDSNTSESIGSADSPLPKVIQTSV